MIDQIFSFFRPDEIDEYTYDEVKVPLRSPEGCRRNDKFWYKTAVRYNEDEIQIYGGRPKNVGWKTVDSETIKYIIQQQLND